MICISSGKARLVMSQASYLSRILQVMFVQLVVCACVFGQQMHSSSFNVEQDLQRQQQQRQTDFLPADRFTAGDKSGGGWQRIQPADVLGFQISMYRPQVSRTAESEAGENSSAASNAPLRRLWELDAAPSQASIAAAGSRMIDFALLVTPRPLFPIVTPLTDILARRNKHAHTEPQVVELRLSLLLLRAPTARPHPNKAAVARSRTESCDPRALL